ncbi:MAG: hypothetical protein M1816_006734 [Peltula sp. TS41687]|nr:MAG: hypothetical protein M1816_006734 [Peltula sp. TS41687]
MPLYIHRQRHRPEMRPPPDSPFDRDGLKQRVEYGCKIRQLRRNISPRLATFVQRLSEKCKALLSGNIKRKEEAERLKDIAVDDDDGMPRSRYEDVHGPKGLCDALVSTIAAMMEIRLQVTYGDYLAISLSRLKDESFNDFLWMQNPRLTWTKVPEVVEEELESLKAYKGSWAIACLTPSCPETPMLYVLQAAATQLGLSRDQLAVEVISYGHRDRLCHSGIKEMIDRCQFFELGKRLLADEALLSFVYEGRWEHQDVLFTLSDKAIRKVDREERRSQRQVNPTPIEPDPNRLKRGSFTIATNTGSTSSRV